MNEVGVDGVSHIGEDRDFSMVIEQAQSMKGFKKTIDPPVYHTVGFNHRAVLPLANQVIEAAQSGALSRIVLVGGCDGSQHERNYFTDLAEELPDDTLILTLGCAKNRFIRSEKLMGAKLSNGMPRISKSALSFVSHIFLFTIKNYKLTNLNCSGHGSMQ